jgi:hypothetical protein
MPLKINRRIDLPIWAFLALLMVFLAGIAGWVINIVKLFGIASSTDPNYVMAALRAIGIFVAPLGAVLGFL